MSKHTPGPWNMYKTPNDPDFVAEIEGIASVYAVSGDALANARLIAAAPELLSALQDCLETEERPKIKAKALAAIAKETGEKQ